MDDMEALPTTQKGKMNDKPTLLRALKDIEVQLANKLSRDKRLLRDCRKRLAANKALAAEIQKQIEPAK